MWNNKSKNEYSKLAQIEYKIDMIGLAQLLNGKCASDLGSTIKNKLSA